MIRDLFIFMTFTVVFCMCSFMAFAQGSFNIHPPFYLWKADDVNTIKDKPLVVVLESYSAAIAKEFKKDPKGLKYYKDQITGKNDAIKFAVENYWNFTKNVSFKSEDEADKMRKSNKCVVLKIGKIQSSLFRRTKTYSGPAPRGFYQDAATERWMNTRTTSGTFELYDEVTTIEIWVPGKKYGALITNLPTDLPSRADVVYGLQQLQYVLNYVDAGHKIKKIEDQYEQNYEELKTKTLLLDKEFLDEKLNEDMIKSIYPYPFEICDREKINKAILDRDAKYAYTMMVPRLGGKKRKYDQYVCSAEDGKIYLTIEKKSSLTVMGITKKRISITEKHIKAYAKK